MARKRQSKHTRKAAKRQGSTSRASPGSLPLLSRHDLPSKFLKPFSPWLNRYLFWYSRKYGIDYREFVRAALDHGWLRLVTYGQKKDVARERVTRIMAWDVVALLWYRPEKAGDATAPEMGAALVNRSDAISDLMHGLGTSVIAAGFSGPAWAVLYFWLHYQLLPSSGLVFARRGLLPIIIWAVFVWLHHSNYKRVRNYLVRLVKNALATHFTHVDKAAVIFVDHSVLGSAGHPVLPAVEAQEGSPS